MTFTVGVHLVHPFRILARAGRTGFPRRVFAMSACWDGTAVAWRGVGG